MAFLLEKERFWEVSLDQLEWFEGRDISDEHAGWRAAKSIRTVVFVEEQNCPRREEFDGLDPESRHLLMRREKDGELIDIGTARWRVVDDGGAATAKLERFAVLAEHRRSGVGHRLVNAVIDDVRARGLRRFMLHAQEYLVDFYRAFGFLTVGRRFIEAGIPHRLMVRDDRDQD